MRLTLIPTVDPRRRRLLRWLALGPVAVSMTLRDSLARADERLQQDLAAPRALSLVSTHTGEHVSVRYFADGQYDPLALQRLHHLLRDHRTGEAAPMDPRLFDQLHALAGCAECAPHYEIISGYRSPATNAKLHAQSNGVARHSLHMEGRAIDVRHTGVACNRLRDLALGMAAGGVGYYAKSNFVHLDTGRVRTWSG
jgi:uncharacterized protein YcbK (DUF882 family)